ncbi:hypothetical protein QTO02_17385, partial [Vibrio fortis]
MKNLTANNSTSMMKKSLWKSRYSAMLIVSLATMLGANQSHAAEEPVRSPVSASEKSERSTTSDSL